MSIASILIQPQRIERATPVADNDATLVTDLLRLGLRLVSTPQHGEQILKIIEIALQGIADTFQTRVTDQSTAVQTRLKKLFNPIMDYFTELGNQLQAENAEDVEAVVKQMLAGLNTILGGLSLDQIRHISTEIFALLEDDLEITPEFIDQQISALLVSIIEQLQTAAFTATDAEHRQNLMELASLLRRLNRRKEIAFRFPRFDAEQIARTLYMTLQRSGISNVGEKTDCATQNIFKITELAKGIHQAVSGVTGQSVGAAACTFSNNTRYLWYASWLLKNEYRDLPLFALDDIKDSSFVTALRTQRDAQSRYLRSKLYDDERTLVDAHDSSEINDGLRIALVSMLNRVIQGEHLESVDAFATVLRSEDTRELGNDYRDSKARVRLNRMILEDHFSGLDQLARGAGRFWPWLWENTFKGDDHVHIDADDKHVFLGDKVLHSFNRQLDWKTMPVFEPAFDGAGMRHYSFQPVSAEFLDAFAYHSSWGNDGLKGFGHLLPWILGEVPGHYLPSIFNSLYDLGHGTNKLITRKPFQGYNCWPFDLLGSLGRPLLTILGSVQHTHGSATFWNQILFWLTVVLGDAIRAMSPNLYLATLPQVARDASLSFMTLMNHPNEWGSSHNSTSRDGPLNHHQGKGIVGPIFMLFTLWLVSEMKREHYTHPFAPGDVPGRVWLLWLLGGTGMGLLAGLTANLVTSFISWVEDWKLLGISMLKGIPSVLLQFWPLMYAYWEGDTNEGKFNPLGGTEFQGYPDKSQTPSPYLLPYATGDSVYMGQGNTGFFSHNPPSNSIGTSNPSTAQTYAYDFSMDQEVEILASRPGTIESFRETSPNDEDTPAGWNFIRIRHDLMEDASGNLVPLNPDSSGNAQPNPVHDRREGGAVSITYGVYGHGRQNGVTDAFGGTTPSVGDQVRQGQPIMLTGDTGVSFHNHLHMHILAQTAGNADTSIAIPFVFEDVEGNGVCQKRQYYVSTNTRRP